MNRSTWKLLADSPVITAMKEIHNLKSTWREEVSQMGELMRRGQGLAEARQARLGRVLLSGLVLCDLRNAAQQCGRLAGLVTRP